MLSTKVGRLLQPDAAAPPERDGYVQRPALAPRFDYSYDGALRSIEDSLQRLGLDAHRHRAASTTSTATPTATRSPRAFAEAMDGAYRALERLRGEGVLGAIGIGVNEWEVVPRRAGRTATSTA